MNYLVIYLHNPNTKRVDMNSCICEILTTLVRHRALFLVYSIDPISNQEVPAAIPVSVLGILLPFVIRHACPNSLIQYVDDTINVVVVTSVQLHLGTGII